MSDDYKEKLKSLSFGTKRGQSERRIIKDERYKDDDDPRAIAGVEIEHWDGSQDAAARPKNIRVKAQLATEEASR